MNIIFEIIFDIILFILLVYSFIEDKIETNNQKLTIGWIIIALNLIFMVLLGVFCVI